MNLKLYLAIRFSIYETNCAVSVYVLTEHKTAIQMAASRRGVSAYLKFGREQSVTCHWLLIYSLEDPIFSFGGIRFS